MLTPLAFPVVMNATTIARTLSGRRITRVLSTSPTGASSIPVHSGTDHERRLPRNDDPIADLPLLFEKRNQHSRPELLIPGRFRTSRACAPPHDSDRFSATIEW